MKLNNLNANYKKLSGGLRREFKKNTASHESVVARCRLIAKCGQNQNQIKALNALITSLEDFGINIQSTMKASIERTVLIEKQIDQKRFEGKLHESYHSKSQELRTNYHNSVQNAKRLANTMTGLIGSCFTHDEQRGLKFTSFGKFYKSIQSNCAALSRGVNNEFLSEVVAFGDATEETVHKYRDNVLEHTDPSRPQDNTNLVTQDGRMQIANYSDIDTGKPLPEIEFDQNMANWVYTDVSDADGNAAGEQYTVHVYLRPDFKVETILNRGDPLMYTTDMGSGHFDRYGGHIHTFRSPNLKVPNATTGASIPFEMPEVSELATTYLNFADKVLDEVEKRLSLVGR